jgi:hypothetical protein
MRSFLSFLLILTPLVFSTAFAAPILEEDFDAVSPPALPASWTSVSLITPSSYSAATSTVQAYSTPNAALIPAPGVTSSTALVTPEINVSNGAASFNLKMSFRHRRGMEPNWDGGVLEISINGAAFTDVTASSVGGAFSAGGYNVPALNSSSPNPLANRAAWSGNSSVFELVSLSIPNLPTETPIKFRFVVGTDSIIGSTGWFIDDVDLTTDVDSTISITPALPAVKAGDPAEFILRHENPSNLTINPSFFYLTQPSGEELVGVNLTSGYISPQTRWARILQALFPVAPFGSNDYSIIVQTENPPHAGAVISLIATSEPVFLGAQLGVAFVSSSPNLPPGGLNNIPAVFVPDDLCSGTVAPPVSTTGSLIVIPQGICSVGQSALNAQSMGALAVLRLNNSMPPMFPSTIGNPFVVEPAVPGLTIPMFSSEVYSTVTTGLSMFASATAGSLRVNLNGKNGALRKTSVVHAFNTGASEATLGNDVRAALIEVYVDSDNDNVADDQESCPSDSNKQAPGACGCGISDTDANANGVFDCLKNQDVRKDVETLKSLISSLKLSSYAKQKAVRNKIKSQRSKVEARLQEAGITTSSTSVNLSKLGSALKKPVSALLKNSSNFTANRKAALKAVNALLKGISAA